MTKENFILTVSCPDKRGIVASVSRYLFDMGCNILDSAQFGDLDNGRFFLRISFASDMGARLAQLQEGFAPIAAEFDMTAAIHDGAVKTRTLIMVSKFGHCLVDLLYRHRIGALPIEIPVIVSNHREFADIAAAHGIPFRYLPVSKDNRKAQENTLAEIIAEERIDLVVLARYMQILSPELCAEMPGRIINIHHSFLPSFKGARPYHQAYERGVKLIGATAHYVTGDLDEGPIIEQSVERATHAMSGDDLAALGRDIENKVLSRAVQWHAEHRILVNGRKTVAFT
ncbi:MAG: formyltetrahydrofolate deformylase [Rhizomicrobium sp.]|nr:formyltetrahydrofolate deformylase [Rhizomicrobium sp.]